MEYSFCNNGSVDLKNILSVEGKTVVIIGASGYLGSVISEGLFLHGANVVLCGKSIEKLNELKEKFSEINTDTNGVDIEIMDVSNLPSISLAFSNIVSKHQKVDAVINTFYYGADGDLEMDEDSWEKGIDGTINAVFRVTKAVIPIMKKQNFGSIINVASMYGMVSPNPENYRGLINDNPPNYGAGKAAIIQFTKYCAVYLAPHNIRVNAVSPGPFPNPEVQQKFPEFIQRLSNKVPLGRIGLPHELVGIMVYLCSDASSYMTGQNICIDGGWTVW